MQKPGRLLLSNEYMPVILVLAGNWSQLSLWPGDVLLRLNTAEVRLLILPIVASTQTWIRAAGYWRLSTHHGRSSNRSIPDCLVLIASSQSTIVWEVMNADVLFRVEMPKSGINRVRIDSHHGTLTEF